MSMCDNMSVGLCIICLHLATMHCGWLLWCTADKVSLVLYWIWNKSTAAHFCWLPHDHRIREKYWKRIGTSAVCWSAHPVHLSGLSRCCGCTVCDTPATSVPSLCVCVWHTQIVPCTKLLQWHTCRANSKWMIPRVAIGSNMHYRETITVETSLGIREAAVTGP